MKAPLELKIVPGLGQLRFAAHNIHLPPLASLWRLQYTNRERSCGRLGNGLSVHESRCCSVKSSRLRLVRDNFPRIIIHSIVHTFTRPRPTQKEAQGGKVQRTGWTGRCFRMPAMNGLTCLLHGGLLEG